MKFYVLVFITFVHYNLCAQNDSILVDFSSIKDMNFTKLKHSKKLTTKQKKQTFDIGYGLVDGFLLEIPRWTSKSDSTIHFEFKANRLHDIYVPVIFEVDSSFVVNQNPNYTDAYVRENNFKYLQ